MAKFNLNIDCFNSANNFGRLKCVVSTKVLITLKMGSREIAQRQRTHAL